MLTEAGARQIAVSGLRAQRIRMNIISNNLANSQTTRTPEGGPYRRKDVVFSTDVQASPFSAVFQKELGTGVRVADVVVDDRAPEMRYLPGHPDADANGHVAFPHLNPAEEMVDLLNASRSYQSNVAAMSAVKEMLNRSIDLMR